MSAPLHHAPDAMLAALAAGALPYPFALLTAAHVSLCDECRARLEAHQLLGGAVLDAMPAAALAPASRDRVLAGLDAAPQAAAGGAADVPAPLDALIAPRGAPWRPLGFGAKQAILWSAPSGSVRLLSIPAGQAVPEHGHRGLELTLVLAGAFADETGVFRAGDLEIADQTLGHTPRATDDGPCLCVAATDAPLRFRALIPRLLQPLLRI